jgi:molybdopterin-synthase adenylyltransferase
MEYDYSQAFSRTIGLLTEAELVRLRNTCVALPGLGGVGGSHLQALARMGIGKFHLADPDEFELVNLSRQLGASIDTIGRLKVDVLNETLHSINPEAVSKLFPSGIDERNIDEFLDGVDIVVDGLEFFRIGTRRLLYAAARRRGIPVVNAGPIGYGAALLVFMPGGMSFDEYFRVDDRMTRAEQVLAFALGIAPTLSSDVDPSTIDFENEKGPALVSACLFCAGAAATEVLKLVCRRGPAAEAPRGVYYDPYRCRMLRLRPRPSLVRSIRGRILRRLSFRRYPALQRMHDREIRARKAAKAPLLIERIAPEEQPGR